MKPERQIDPEGIADAGPAADCSALYDGALQRDAARFLLGRIERDAELRQRWARWALASDVLTRRPVAIAPPDFADRIQQAIAAEGMRPRMQGAGRGGWLRLAGGLAVAASVAFVAVTVVSTPVAGPGTPAAQSVADAPLASPPSRAPMVGPVTVNARGVQQVAVGGLAQPVSFVPFQGEDAYWIRHGLGAQVAPLGALGTLAWLPREEVPTAAQAEMRAVPVDAVE